MVGGWDGEGTLGNLWATGEHRTQGSALHPLTAQGLRWHAYSYGDGDNGNNKLLLFSLALLEGQSWSEVRVWNKM